jgi:hypothetical protein
VVGAYGANGEKRNVYRLMVGRPEGKETTKKTKK